MDDLEFDAQKLRDDAIKTYGDPFGSASSSLLSWWAEWGRHPANREEVQKAVDTYVWATQSGYFSERIVYGHREVIRTIILTRRGVDVRQELTEDDLKVMVFEPCNCGWCDDDCLNMRIGNLTGEIIRLALEW